MSAFEISIPLRLTSESKSLDREAGARGKHQPKDARSPASLGTWECESFDASHVVVHSSAAR